MYVMLQAGGFPFRRIGMNRRRSTSGLEDKDFDIDLRLKGKIVSRCCIDAAFSLEVLEKGSRTVIRIARQMTIEQGGKRLDLSGGKPTQAGQASILQGKTIEQAIGRKDGSLDVSFTDGSRLVVPIDPRYEAWEVSATDGFMVVSLPGGGLTAWKPR
jgi:hypothetical protein